MERMKCFLFLSRIKSDYFLFINAVKKPFIHLFISRDSLTLNDQEISPKSESGDCFSVIPVITVLLLELHHALAWAGPSVGHKYSGRTLEMPCFKKKKKRNALLYSHFRRLRLDMDPLSTLGSSKHPPNHGN